VNDTHVNEETKLLSEEIEERVQKRDAGNLSENKVKKYNAKIESAKQQLVMAVTRLIKSSWPSENSRLVLGVLRAKDGSMEEDDTDNDIDDDADEEDTDTGINFDDEDDDGEENDEEDEVSQDEYEDQDENDEEEEEEDEEAEDEEENAITLVFLKTTKSRGCFFGCSGKAKADTLTMTVQPAQGVTFSKDPNIAEFKTLDKQLRRDLGKDKAKLPKFEDEAGLDVDERRTRLQTYIDKLCRLPEAQESKCLQDFLANPSPDEDEDQGDASEQVEEDDADEEEEDDEEEEEEPVPVRKKLSSKKSNKEKNGNRSRA